jgi:Leucine-rich repeat (LRR) protein
MKRFFILIGIFLLSGLVDAQENQAAYETALQMIREAGATGASELDLSNLELTELPPEIGTLTALEELSLYGNLLSSLPREIGNLQYLKELNLDVNEFQSLPPEIGRLTNLLTLSASYNQIATLPPEIGNLQNLDSLWLEDNQLTVLPAEIGRLSNLYLLILNNNQLSSLPSEIANLDKLCVLSLESNQFVYLPTDLAELQTMRDGLNCGINLVGNPLVSPPPDVLAQGTPAILEYLRNEAWWNTLKLIGSIVVGIVLVLTFFWGFYRRSQSLSEKQAKNQ